MLVVIQVLVFALAMAFGFFLCLLFHEVGHALAAVSFTSQPVTIQWGLGEPRRSLAIGRLTIRLGAKGYHLAWTEYDRSLEDRRTQLGVALAGPIATLLALWLLGLWLGNVATFSWAWLVALGGFIANFRVLMTSLLPGRMFNPVDPNEEWLSDSLDIWRLLKR